mmetsp:Transcript_13971/g.22487  ORF Transcript_13971/g.22487 Transcript_13971/m.22487 type:complete len:209 (-) Transcript_13971:352-978(-)
MQNLVVQFGKIQNELGQFFVSVVRRSKAVDGATFELRRIIRNAGDRLGDVDCPHRLGQSRSIFNHWNDTIDLGHVGKVMQELVFCTEQLRGADNGGPRIDFSNRLFSEILCPGPFRGMIGRCRRGRHMNKMIDLHLHTKFGDLLGNSHIDIFDGEIRLPTNVRELAGLNRLTSGMNLGNEIDDNVCIGNHLLHGIDISGTVEDKSSVS